MIYSVILTILIFIFAAASFHLYFKNEMRRLRDEDRSKQTAILRHNSHYPRNSSDSPDTSYPDYADQLSDSDTHTIDLIGREAFDAMNDRIEQILNTHKTHLCISVRLTCGTQSEQGREQLHRILPGMPVELLPSVEDGIDWIDVFSEGKHIGRFALMETMLIRDCMESNHIRGAYVAEQNCFGIPESHELSIIIFYEPKEYASSEESIQSMGMTPEIEATSARDISQICEN